MHLLFKNPLAQLDFSSTVPPLHGLVASSATTFSLRFLTRSFADCGYLARARDRIFHYS